jgi:hypothetical protein
MGFDALRGEAVSLSYDGVSLRQAAEFRVPW